MTDSLKGIAYARFNLDNTDLSEVGFETFKKFLADFGLYLGDVEYEYHGEAVSSIWCLYLSNRQFTKEELKSEFKVLELEPEEDIKTGTLYLLRRGAGRFGINYYTDNLPKPEEPCELVSEWKDVPISLINELKGDM